MLLGRRVIGEMLLERIPLESVPENPEEASKWLYENYRHKVSFELIITVWDIDSKKYSNTLFSINMSKESLEEKAWTMNI